MATRISRRVGFVLFAAGLISILVWFLAPAVTIAERYRHVESGNLYEFRNGRVIIDGVDFGRYEVGLFRVRLTLEKIEPFVGNDAAVVDATIGWNTLLMPLPKYGASVLRKELRPPRYDAPDGSSFRAGSD